MEDEMEVMKMKPHEWASYPGDLVMASTFDAVLQRAEAAEAAIEKHRRDNDESVAEYKKDSVQDHAVILAFQRRAEAAEALIAEYRDTFTAANEMRLSEVRLRQAVQQRAELAEMRCTEALDRLEVANQQLAELRAANERMRAAMNDIDAYVRDIRHGATFADSMRDTIIITIRQALAKPSAEVGE